MQNLGNPTFSKAKFAYETYWPLTNSEIGN